MGSSSLIGLVAKELGPPQEIRIEFQQTSLDWRRKHNGADEIIIPEYTPMCLCQDVLTLGKLGYTVEVEDYVYDGEEEN